MGQIIKSLMSFSYSCNFDSILMKFCRVIQGPRSKIEFVCDKKSDNFFPYFTPNFKKFALRPLGTSKRYNSALVKDNCTLFAPTPYFRAHAIRWCHLNFFLPTPVAMVTNFGTKLTITRHS